MESITEFILRMAMYSHYLHFAFSSSGYKLGLVWFVKWIVGKQLWIALTFLEVTEQYMVDLSHEDDQIWPKYLYDHWAVYGEAN